MAQWSLETMCVLGFIRPELELSKTNFEFERSSSVQMMPDSQVQESITNISIWLQTQCRIAPYDKQHEVCAEDLAIAVPGECLFPSLMQDNEEATREEEKGILVYTDSRDEKHCWLYGYWYPLEKVLNIPAPKNGWVRTVTLGERLLLLILTQLDYRAEESQCEVPYGCCPLEDPGYLLWQNNRAVGMCSLKRKGTSIWGGEESYSCTTLDTLFVRHFARRRGHTLELLRLLTSQLPHGEHFALSHPISLKMCKVLLKFVHVYPELSEYLWTLDEDGEVSGTVILMLGSLMMRGILTPPNYNQNQAHHLAQGSYNKFGEGQMMTDKHEKISDEKSLLQQQPMTPEQSPSVDEPCDTS